MPIAANTSSHRSATKPHAPKGAGFGRAAATTPAPASANPKTDASAAQPPPKPVSQLQPKAQAQALSKDQSKDQSEVRSDAKHSPKLNANADAAVPSAEHPLAAAAGAAAVNGAVPAAPAVTRQRVVVRSLKAVGPAGAAAAKWGDETDAKRTGGGGSAGGSAAKQQPQVPGAAAAATAKPSADAKGASGAAVDDADSAVCGDERLKGFANVKTFDDLKLNEQLLRGVFAYGYEVPSVIQAKGIPALVLGHDTIAQAQSGTGKTATFCIGALQRLSVNIALKQSQVLVLSPTRELAQQTYRVCKALGDYLAPTVHLCVGGTHTAADRAALSGPNAAQVVIGTPGRVLHLLNSNGLKAKALTMLVVDEADEMLSAGFQEQMYGVFERLPKDIQICLFSATLTDECMALADKFMRNPVRITIKREDVTLEGIKQFFVDVTGDANQAVARGGGRRQQQADDNAKLQVLCDLYESMSVSQCIVYANSRARVEWLADALNAQDFTVSALHAQLEPPEREAVMARFRTGASRVLIATDLIARGIDVHGVSLVINFDLPIVRENYIHRIGRSGRFGRKGVAINFVAHRDDVAALRQLETFYATAINELPANVKDLMG